MPVLKNVKQHKLLLDTHIWIWLMLKDRQISSAFVPAFEAAIESHHVYISPMSIWEIGMLTEKKRLELEIDCLDWVEQAEVGFELVPISTRIAIQSSRIPGLNHADPVDRLLIATAREINAVLVTHDEKILQFGKEKFIYVFDPVH